MNQIVLRGCAPEPLIHYLKALGILRLVAEQLDLQARAAWHGDTFMLKTEKTEEDLVDFFLNRYRPTPIVAPWNGSSGFYPKDAKQRDFFTTLCRANNERFIEYAETLAAGRLIVGERTEQPKAEEKEAMLQAARQVFSDKAVDWLDAAFVLGEGKPEYPPLLGSGGNDGRLDFTVNFVARLLSAFPETLRNEKKSQEKIKQAHTQIRAALFGEEIATLENAAVGQFYPAGAGGVNADQGATGSSYVNPWDYILALEGSLMLASAPVRQLAVGARTKASFPFTVQNSNIGYGTATDNEKVRAEIWLPLWSRFTSYVEIAHIFKEGRVQFSNRRTVRTAFDFARAVAELGVDRGIDAFQRYAFIERNGQANLATPLGIFEVRERPLVTRLYELDRHRWLDSFVRATSDDKAPPRFVRARKRIEEAIFKLCATGNVAHLRETLIALGAAEAELSDGEKFRDDKNLRPLTGLSLRWVSECNDGSDEFRIAAALAAMRGEAKVGLFRTNIESFDAVSRNWAQRSTSAVWSNAGLDENLASVLQRRSIDARSQSLSHPLVSGSRFASLASVDAFLNRETDDEKLEDLLRGLILIDWSQDKTLASNIEKRNVPPKLSRAYALLKLLFLPEGTFQSKPDAETIVIKHEPSIIPLLRAGRVSDALDTAARRLRASGVRPLTADFNFRAEDGTRLAAALLIPIDEPSIREIARLVLHDEADE